MTPVPAVRRTKSRSEYLKRVATCGVPVPNQYTGPLVNIPFERYVIKSGRESESYPVRLVRSDADRNRVREQISPDETVYAQSFLDSEWEYKLYCIGDEVFGFRQRPTLLDPDAQQTGREIALDACQLPQASTAARSASALS